MYEAIIHKETKEIIEVHQCHLAALEGLKFWNLETFGKCVKKIVSITEYINYCNGRKLKYTGEIDG